MMVGGIDHWRRWKSRLVMLSDASRTSFLPKQVLVSRTSNPIHVLQEIRHFRVVDWVIWTRSFFS